MTAPFEQFVERIVRSGLVPHEILGPLLEDLSPADAHLLAEKLVAAGYLTPFQAQALRESEDAALVLGNYVILDSLGAGGMGQVFKAQHRHMDRIVALKVLHPQAREVADALDRFRREVRAAAKLIHPNIVTAFDADSWEGLPYLVMEYVPGRDLATLVKSHRPLPVSLALQCTLQACRALEYAHGLGVVHRDIKPSNLLVDKQGTVKVLDMGLARMDALDPTDNSITKTGDIMGTVDFMAPEQATDMKNADARSDIYSLGCSLYFLLTGKLAFAGANPLEKVLAHREQPFPALRGELPAAPAALETMLYFMTEKSPHDRCRTVAEVAGMLGALQAELEDDADFQLSTALDAIPSPSAPTHTLSLEHTQGSVVPAATIALQSPGQTARKQEQEQALSAFILACAVDGFMDIEEEHEVFRRGGARGMSVAEIEAVLQENCRQANCLRQSEVTQTLTTMLEEATQDDGAIDQQEYEAIISYAVSCRMPRRAADEHCVTLILDNGWQAKQSLFNRWFAKKLNHYGWK